MASLKSASPSMSVLTRRGAPRRRKTLVAASASVGATIAPRVKAAAHADVGQRELGNDGDDDHREENQADGEPEDRRTFGPELADRCLDRRDEQQRRQEEEQDQVRLEIDCREAGDQPEDQSAEHEDRGIRRSDPPRELEEDGDRDEDDEDGNQDAHRFGHVDGSGRLLPDRCRPCHLRSHCCASVGRIVETVMGRFTAS